jgi:hypothetical protein
MRIVAILAVLFTFPAMLTSEDAIQEIRVTSPPPITGTVEVSPGERLQYRYWFDRNALVDVAHSGNVFIALTRSGNLLRFDADSLAMTGEHVVTGDGYAISVDSRGRLLLGTGDGRIDEIDPVTWKRTEIARTSGRVLWLARGGVGATETTVAVTRRGSLIGIPGEPIEDYWKRDRQQPKESVVVVTAGRSRTITLPERLDFPATFGVVWPDKLWIGADKGEFGGMVFRVDLAGGNVKKIKSNSVLGFLPTTDRGLLAYGGTSHLGFDSGYVARVTESGLEYLREFGHGPFDAKADQSVPSGPIDFIASSPPDPENRDGATFWALAGQSVFRTNANFSQWSRVAVVGGRWRGPRSYAVGAAPSAIRGAINPARPGGFVVATRDGLAQVASGNAERRLFRSQIEEPVTQIRPTPAGILFLAGSFSSSAWRLIDGAPGELPLKPVGLPSSEFAWMPPEVVGEDGDDIVVFVKESVTPGKRALARIAPDGSSQRLDLWEDREVWIPGMDFLPAIGVGAVAIDDGMLRQRVDGKWLTIGVNDYAPDWTTRFLLRSSMRYAPLASDGVHDFILDTALGQFLQLTRPPDGPWRLELLRYGRRQAPKGVFDASPDDPGWMLAATASGLVRFRLNEGQSERIPSPNTAERFTSLVHDKAGWLWTAGNRIYVSKNEGMTWAQVDLPMLPAGDVSELKKLKPNPASLHGMWIALGDRGIVAID